MNYNKIPILFRNSIKKCYLGRSKCPDMIKLSTIYELNKKYKYKWEKITKKIINDVYIIINYEKEKEMKLGLQKIKVKIKKL